jgi:hypothetical protein
VKKSQTRRPSTRNDTATEALIEEITVDAYGDDEQLWAFRQAFEDNVDLPTEGLLVGQPVAVLAIDYDGNERRGLTARVRGADGHEHMIAAADLVMPVDSDAGRYLPAYRKWMGLPTKAPPTAAKSLLGTSGPVDLIIVSLKQKAARCRVVSNNLDITLRATRLWDVVPGEIARIKPSKQWIYAGHPYLSGELESTRLDASALGLVPLKLQDQGRWDPAEEYWGEEGEPIDDWAKPIIAKGPRRAYEMEQVLPGMDPEDPCADPITDANDRKDAGDVQGAYKILMDLCQADLRCLDAHAHLGNLAFDSLTKDAIRHYEIGFRIGDLSLGKKFDDVLPWGMIDNRPFLRCMHGFGLCLWRLRRFDEAATTFERMLWLNPSDNQGVRFLIDEVHARVTWEKSRNR